jgi:hypothetical protein
MNDSPDSWLTNVVRMRALFTHRLDLAIIAVITPFLIISILFAFWIHHRNPAFVMIITARKDSSIVRFVQPRKYEGYRPTSPKFAVEAVVQKSLELELGDAAKNLPGATIEFSDTTILPGRIRIRYGGRTFDVMESRIIVDGADVSWLHDEGN